MRRLTSVKPNTDGGRESNQMITLRINTNNFGDNVDIHFARNAYLDKYLPRLAMADWSSCDMLRKRCLQPFFDVGQTASDVCERSQLSSVKKETLLLLLLWKLRRIAGISST